MAGWAPDYASPSELAALVRVGDTLDDAQLALALSTASRAVDLAAGRQFGILSAVEARTYTARWDRSLYRWVIEVDDLMTTVGLIVKVDSLTADGSYPSTIDNAYVQTRPTNAVVKGRPWTSLALRPMTPSWVTGEEAGFQVTAKWGWTAVPTAIKQATLLQASRLLARRDSPFGIAGSPDAGSELRLLARVDPDVAVAVAPFRRWWGAR